MRRECAANRECLPCSRSRGRPNASGTDKSARSMEVKAAARWSRDALAASKAVTKRQTGVRVPAVGTQEIVAIAGERDRGNRRAPVLSACLRVLSLRIQALPVLPHRSFDLDTAVGVDRIRGSRDDRTAQP